MTENVCGSVGGGVTAVVALSIWAIICYIQGLGDKE